MVVYLDEMTADEFELHYAKGDPNVVKLLHEHGCHASPCTCETDESPHWQMECSDARFPPSVKKKPTRARRNRRKAANQSTNAERIRRAIRILLESNDIELIKKEMLDITDYILGLEEVIIRAERIGVERIGYIETFPDVIKERFGVILTHHRNRASEDQDYFNRKIHLAVVAEVEAAQTQILEGLK